MGGCEALKEVGRRGQNHKTRGKADAVDGEASQPLFKVIPLGTKYEVLVAKKRDRNADWG